MIYADFETILEKIDPVSPNPNKSYTNKYQKILLVVSVIISNHLLVINTSEKFIEEKMLQRSLEDDWKKTVKDKAK